MPLPGEAIRAGRRFLADGRRIEVDHDFLTDEMQSGFAHIQGDNKIPCEYREFVSSF
jgi:hypothetical protein